MLSRFGLKFVSRVACRASSTNSKLVGREMGAYLLHPTTDPTQFSKSNLKNHGELEDGQIPEALKFSRQCTEMTLSNGFRLGVESSSSPRANVSLVVKSGVRNETIKTSGIGYFITQLRKRGTDKRTQEQLEDELLSLGATLDIEAGRELTTYNLSAPANNLEKAFEILADVAKSNNFKSENVEAVRNSILHEMQQLDPPEKIVLDNVNYTAFRDDMIGQPIRGNSKSIASITLPQIQEYINTHYTGSRSSLGVVGNVDANKVRDLADKHFGQLPRNTADVLGEVKPVFTGSQIQMRDDDVDLNHTGIFYLAPSWHDEDFFAFQMLTRLMGDYIPERDAIINHPQLQYNYLHSRLGEIEDIGIHKSYYIPYEHTGLFGHYMNCLDMTAVLANAQLMKSTTRATGLIMESELYRSRNKYYNDLMASYVNPKENAQEIATQLTYAGRRIHRSEVAKRIACLNARNLEKIYAKWLWDCELAMVFYGAIFTSVRSYRVHRGFTNHTNQH